MAVITMRESRVRVVHRNPVAPIGVPMTDISCVLLLLLAFHGIARIGLALAVFEALMLWWALNARSVQVHRVTIAQRFFRLPALQTGEISVGHTAHWSLVMSLCSPLVWLIDWFVGATGFSERSTKTPEGSTSTANHNQPPTPFVSTDSRVFYGRRDPAFNAVASLCQDEQSNISTIAPSSGERVCR